MVKVTQFDNEFVNSLPQTCELLQQGNLVVNPRVYQIILHGSRGLQGGAQSDSDIDLTLVVDDSGLDEDFEHESFLKAVLEETLSEWKGRVKLDLRAAFDLRGCRLACLTNPKINIKRCPQKGIDCFGIYKIQKGEPGYVLHAGSQVSKMRPCIKVWQNS